MLFYLILPAYTAQPEPQPKTFKPTDATLQVRLLIAVPEPSANLKCMLNYRTGSGSDLADPQESTGESPTGPMNVGTLKARQRPKVE